MTSWLSLRDATRGGLNGWLEAGLFVIAISALTVLYAVAQQLGAHTLVFTFYAMAAASMGMLAITGLGTDFYAVIMARQSWLFGTATVGLEALYFVLLGILSPAETSLALRLSVPVSLFIGWVCFAREMSGGILLGAGLIIAAVLPVLWGLDDDRALPATLLTLACAIVVSVKTFASEFHPWNRSARTALDKLRVTGLVVLATTMIAAIALSSAVLLAVAGLIPKNPVIPEPAAFWHVPTLITALLCGAPVFIAMTYLTFSSVVKIGTESFLGASAFTPFAALGLEFGAARVGLVAFPSYDWQLIPLIALGIFGVLIIIRDLHKLDRPEIRPG